MMHSAEVQAKQEGRWEAERDCDTLMRAEEVKADKKRFHAAMKFAMEKKNAMMKMMDGNRPLSKGDM